MARRAPRHRLPVPHETGRPSKLTPDTEATVLEAVKDGCHLGAACEAAGIGRTTLYRWIETADAADQAAQNGQPIDPADEPYRDFRDRLRVARALAENHAVRVVKRSMDGGNLISEKPVVDMEGNPVRGDNGKILMERVWSQPDGRLALSYLGRARPGEWGQNATSRIELTGAEGGPVAVGSSSPGTADQIESLRLRLATVVEQRRANEAALEADEAGDVHDAVIVEDDDS